MEKLPGEVWRTFGPTTAKKLLSQALCDGMELDSLVDPSTILQAVAEIEIPEEIEMNDDLDSLSARSGWTSAKTTESTRAKYAETQEILEERTAQVVQATNENREHKRMLREQEKQIKELQASMMKIMRQVNIQGKKRNCHERIGRIGHRDHVRRLRRK